MNNFSQFSAEDTYYFNGKEFQHDPMMSIVLVDGTKTPAYELMGMEVDEAKEISFNIKLKNLRAYRTQKLSESDWRANSDVIMSNEWKEYRQTLRDLPSTLTSWEDFENFEWPIEP